MIRFVKKFGIALFLLALGLIVGALVFHPADVALGQDDAQHFIVAFPPSPCTITVQSRLDFAVDGSSNGWWLAVPPSPCTVPTLDIVSVPENTARCVQTTERARAVRVSCDFTAEHQTTTFFLNSIARD
ncbi:MAG: hypothetical protein KDJ52_21215 [Anaerolineae bacterium]|nr:hypothetical protein [Anaerolineae bacterium]